MAERTGLVDRVEQISKQQRQEIQQLLGRLAVSCNQATRQVREKHTELKDRTGQHIKEKLNTLASHSAQQTKDFCDSVGLDGDKVVAKAQEYGHNTVLIVRESPYLMAAAMRIVEGSMEVSLDETYAFCKRMMAKRRNRKSGQPNPPKAIEGQPSKSMLALAKSTSRPPSDKPER